MEDHWDIRNVVRGPDALLATTENPRHRAMLLNFRRHALLEITGRWQEILQPSMLVPEPVYRINENGQSLVLRGQPEVADFYRIMTENGMTVFGPLSENIAVADWGLAIESHFLHHIPGTALRAQGADVDPAAHYQLTHYMASFWPYDQEVRLIGEHIYEDLGSRELVELDPGRVITPQEATEALEPFLLSAPTL
jgi:hypothetical protein